MNKKTDIYIAIDLFKWEVYATLTKEDLAGYVGVHRNTIRLTDNKAILGKYLVFKGNILLKNNNMVRDFEKNIRRDR